MIEKDSLWKSGLCRWLGALAYPSAESFSPFSLDDVVKLVTWLEDRKIRILDIDDRKPLRQANNGPAWTNAFQSYLASLECPYEWTGIGMTDTSSAQALQDRKVLTWIIQKAISYECEDIEPETTLPPPSILAATSRTVWLKALKILYDEYGVDAVYDGRSLVRSLRSLNKALERMEQKNHRAPSRGQKMEKDMAQQLALLQSAQTQGNPARNQTSQDLVMDRAVTLLRVIYLGGLRGLQTEANSLLVVAQDFTANPVTNANLGKVGY